MVASLQIEAPKKATRDTDKQMIQSRVYALQRRYSPNADSLGQWRKSYHYIVTTKPVVLNTPASGTCRPPLLVLAYMTSFSHVVGLRQMHELHQQYSPHFQQKGCANGFLPKCLFCGALAAGYQINATLSSKCLILTP